MMSDSPLTMELGEDYPEIREAVARVCEEFPGEYWRRQEEDRAYPDEFVATLTREGWLAALIPTEYGGSGLPLRAAAVILETIHASGCNAGACHAQMYIMGTLLRHGNKAQKERYLPAIAAGKLRLQAFAVTEPSTGSDTTQIKTRAVRDGDHFIVDGQKLWTSRALQSDLMLLLARTTPLDTITKRGDGLTVFLINLVEAIGNGVEIRPVDAMINHNTTEIFIDKLKIPADSVVGEEGKGFWHILDGMNAERILIAAEAVGDARWFTAKAATYSTEREVFGKPIGANQGIQFPIARAHAETEAADLMGRMAAALFDAGKPCGAEANMAKMLASEATWHAGDTCFQTFGGFAFAREYDIERKWRETRLFRTAPISTNMILAYIGQHVLGMPRSY